MTGRGGASGVSAWGWDLPQLGYLGVIKEVPIDLQKAA
jgi:hypothetical protein